MRSSNNNRSGIRHYCRHQRTTTWSPVINRCVYLVVMALCLGLAINGTAAAGPIEIDSIEQLQLTGNDWEGESEGEPEEGETEGEPEEGEPEEGEPEEGEPEGEGEAASPIEIDSIEKLQLIGNDPDYPLDGDYILTQDIDASDTVNWNDGAGFKPIGELDDDQDAFSGIFDGQGHVITGLVIDRPDEDNIGLFGCIGVLQLQVHAYAWSGVIKNVGVSDVTITGRDSVGGLVGSNRGSILQCFVTGNVTGNNNVGGLVGYGGGGYYTSVFPGIMVSNCYAVCVVTGNSRVGGFMGRYYGFDFSCNYAASHVTFDSAGGGLTGSYGIPAGFSVFVSSFWDMESSNLRKSAGGRGLTTQQMTTPSIFANAGWDPDVWVMTEGDYPRLAWESTGAAPLPAPEPIPLSGRGTESDPYQIGTPQEFDLLNWHYDAIDANFILTANLDYRDISFYPIGDLGRFSGVLDGQGHKINNAVIDSSFGYSGVFKITNLAKLRNIGIKNITITDGHYVGALAGINAGSIIEGCYATGTISGRIAGGLVGYNGFAYYGAAAIDSVIFESYATVKVSGRDDAGGLVGVNITGPLNNNLIARCYATGPVSGRSAGTLGGLVGRNRGNIVDSYATGAVTGARTRGGLVGVNTHNSRSGSVSVYPYGGTIRRCYSTGEIGSGDNNLGGLVGSGVSHSIDADRSNFWDIETSGISESADGTGLTTVQMQDRGTYEDTWNFDDVWYMMEDGSYPFLQALPQTKVPDVTGMNEEDASAALETAGLTVRTTYEHCHTTPQGEVCSQSVSAGSYVHINNTVVGIIVSLGAPPEGEDLDLQAVARVLLEQFDDLDTDGDGLLSIEEVRAVFPDLTDEQFAALDISGDGYLSREELEETLSDHAEGEGEGQPEGETEGETEGESEGEGEGEGEGEDDDTTDGCLGCGGCGGEQPADKLKRLLGDWLLMGLSLLVLLSVAGIQSKR